MRAQNTLSRLLVLAVLLSAFPVASQAEQTLTAILGEEMAQELNLPE